MSQLCSNRPIELLDGGNVAGREKKLWVHNNGSKWRAKTLRMWGSTMKFGTLHERQRKRHNAKRAEHAGKISACPLPRALLSLPYGIWYCFLFCERPRARTHTHSGEFLRAWGREWPIKGWRNSTTSFTNPFHGLLFLSPFVFRFF